jgi:proline racemase
VTFYRRVVHTIDSHTEGNATRVIVGGVPQPPGRTLLEKQAWLMRHDDALRRMLNFEPRGSGMMCSVLLLPPASPDAQFAAIIMEQDEYVPMCGHCIIGTATTVVANGMVAAVSPATTVRFDTPAGLVTCHVGVENGRIGPVSFENVESFMLLEGASLTVPGYGMLSVDIAYGGDFYAFVDADALGLDIGPNNAAALIAAWSNIRQAVRDQLSVVHPERPDINRCYQVLFYTGGRRKGEYRQTILCPPGSVDRSPCGTGTSARVALLYTKGEIGLGEAHRFEGVLGTAFTGEAVKAGKRGNTLFVTPRITGHAHITGYHQFVLEPEDPLPEGYRIGNA